MPKMAFCNFASTRLRELHSYASPEDAFRLASTQPSQKSVKKAKLNAISYFSWSRRLVVAPGIHILMLFFCFFCASWLLIVQGARYRYIFFACFLFFFAFWRGRVRIYAFLLLPIPVFCF